MLKACQRGDGKRAKGKQVERHAFVAFSFSLEYLSMTAWTSSSLGTLNMTMRVIPPMLDVWWDCLVRLGAFTGIAEDL